MAVRPGWDVYFLDIARAVSKRADCTRRQVGCVIVNSDHKIIATGYNGVRPGALGCLEGACPRGQLSYTEVQEFSDYSNPASPGYCISSHAETNALMHAGKDCTGAYVYITDQPCPACRKMLYNAGVTRVVWPSGWLAYTSGSQFDLTLP